MLFNQNKTPTTNGAIALDSTGDNCTNFFFNIGSARNNPNIVNVFAQAYIQNKELALAILLWSRDIRNGAGERNSFKSIVSKFDEIDESLAEKVIKLIPTIGRFDDLLCVYNTKYEKLALSIWADELKKGNALAFKWTDRSDKKLRCYMGFKNEAEFRKYIAKGRKNTIVEEKMCKNDWAYINYSKLPSIAGARYAKSFKKHDLTRYTMFLNDKKQKINTKALFPHDVYRTFKAGQIEAANKLWENLPKLELCGNILVMPDVSGSMSCTASGMITCMDISISLGAYIAQNISGFFKNKLLTFSSSPDLVTIPNTNNIEDIFNFISNIDWGGSTNVVAAFETILESAKLYNVPQSEMPSHLLILSDMQFDENNRIENNNTTIFTDMKMLFEKSGYKLPKVIFWNLNGKYKNFPTSSIENDVALVSGFSPSVLKNILASKEFNPKSIMMETITPYIKMLQDKK